MSTKQKNVKRRTIIGMFGELEMMRDLEREFAAQERSMTEIMRKRREARKDR